jgi:hypothetical protein
MMNLDTALATGMFALIAMALFLFVWCLLGLIAFYLSSRARHGKSRSAFELERNARGLNAAQELAVASSFDHTRNMSISRSSAETAE